MIFKGILNFVICISGIRSWGLTSSDNGLVPVQRLLWQGTCLHLKQFSMLSWWQYESMLTEVHHYLNIWALVWLMVATFPFKKLAISSSLPVSGDGPPGDWDLLWNPTNERGIIRRQEAADHPVTLGINRNPGMQVDWGCWKKNLYIYLVIKQKFGVGW